MWQGGSYLGCHFLKFIVTEIAEEMRRLRVLDVWLHNADVIGNVAVDGEYVGQSVEVIIEKECAKSQRPVRHGGDAGFGGFVREKPRAIVVIERHALVGEIAENETLPTGFVIVRRVGTHARASRARFAVGKAGGNSYIGESAVVIIVVELVRLGIVWDEEIEPSVVVVVEQRDAERFAGRIIETCLLRYVLESPIAFVVEQC